MDRGDDYCGCCGHMAMPGRLWCADCLVHVADVGEPWDRTFFALHGRDCPFQACGKRGERVAPASGPEVR